jgi:hypothetical protein
MRNGLAEEITLPLNQSVFRELMIRNAVWYNEVYARKNLRVC